MTDIFPVVVELQGTGPAYVTADQPNLIIRGATRALVHVINNGTGPFQLSITPANPVEGVPLRTLTVVVPAGAPRFFGPLPRLVLDANGDLPFTVAAANLAAVQITALAAR